MRFGLTIPQTVKEKIRALAIICFLLVGSMAIAYALKTTGVLAGALFIVAMVGLPAIYGIVMFPRFGIIILMCMDFLVMWFLRLGVNFPLGTAMDAIEVLLLFNLIMTQRARPNWGVFKSPITTIILVWLAYNMLEFANPTTESRLAWVYTIRSVAIVSLTYFVFVYNIKDVKFIRLLLKLWLAFALFAALYAFRQEQFGFFDFEQAQLDADPRQQMLYFINGHWRKFSIFSDPVAFSYVMAMSAILCVALIWGPTRPRQKIILAALASFFMVVMLYSGTRGANMLLPGALFLFSILCYNKKVLIFAMVAAFFMLVLINIPTGNPSLQRFQSSFRPSNDASFNVRAQNQKMIQPYIWKHPMGGGLGATGMWGVRFAPSSFLANFPPDSGYVRVAVELGWIGLILICTLFFIVLKTGIENFYAIKDPELKAYCLGMTLMIFAFNIANYPQEALVQFPLNICFYLAIALIIVTRRLDDEKQKNLLTTA